MKRIVLDATPVGLILQKTKYLQRDLCKRWLIEHLGAGDRVYVPEIVVYEIRRELLRLNKAAALKALDIFTGAVTDRLIILNSRDLRLAAELWAKSRQLGKPTADPHALDVDIILCAQVLNAGFDLNDVVVATSNAKHLDHFVNAQDWQSI